VDSDRSNEESDGTIYQRIADTVRLLVESGTTEDEALADVIGEVSRSIDPHVDQVYTELLRKQATLMRHERRLRRHVHADIYSYSPDRMAPHPSTPVPIHTPSTSRSPLVDTGHDVCGPVGHTIARPRGPEHR